MENERIYSQELEEMRSQIEILKGKLSKQDIINEKHITRSIKTNMSEIKRTVAASIIAGSLSLPYCTWIFYKFGFSLYFTIATCIMLAVCLIITIRQQYTLKKLDISQGNLIEVAEKLNKVKKHYHEWIKIALPIIVIWVSWLTYEGLTYMESGPIQTGFITGTIVGCVIGGIIGGRINRKIVKKSTEILNQIDELLLTDEPVK